MLKLSGAYLEVHSLLQYDSIYKTTFNSLPHKKTYMVYHYTSLKQARFHTVKPISVIRFEHYFFHPDDQNTASVCLAQDNH